MTTMKDLESWRFKREFFVRASKFLVRKETKVQDRRKSETWKLGFIKQMD